MQFLRKKTKIAESKNCFTVIEKALALQIGESFKNDGPAYLIRINAAMQLHPPVPVPDTQIFIQDDQTNINHVKYLEKNH